MANDSDLYDFGLRADAFGGVGSESAMPPVQPASSPRQVRAGKRKAEFEDSESISAPKPSRNKKQKSRGEASGAENGDDTMQYPSSVIEVPLSNSQKLALVVDAFHQLDEADIVYWFATEPDLTCWDSFNPDKDEVEEIRATANGLLDDFIRSQEWSDAVCLSDHLDRLADWAAWLALDSEARKSATIGATLPSTFRPLIRSWFRTGERDILEVADYLQLQLYGIEIDHSKPLTPYAQKMLNWYFTAASQKLRYEEELSTRTVEERADLVDHSGLELLTEPTNAEKEAIHFVAEAIAAYEAQPERKASFAKPTEPLAAATSLNPKMKARRTDRCSAPFTMSPYYKINGWELSNLLQQMCQKSQNPTNEQKVSWLLQAGKKRRLDELARENVSDQTARKKRGKESSQTQRTVKGLAKGQRAMTVNKAVRNYWAAFIDRGMSFEDALNKAKQMEEDGTVPQEPVTQGDSLASVLPSDAVQEDEGYEEELQTSNVLEETVINAPRQDPAQSEESDEDAPDNVSQGVPWL